jgi:hypothetical protein
MERRSRKKRIAALLVFLMALAITTGAVAYFTGASNSATGSGTVGASTQWGITTGTPTWSGSLTALYPGAASDTEYVPFTVTNNGHGYQSVQSITASVTAETNGDAETTSATDITGCKASWFTAAVDAGNPTLPSDVAAGGTYTGKIDLTMQDSGSNQNACENASPAISITVS